MLPQQLQLFQKIMDYVEHTKISVKPLLYFATVVSFMAMLYVLFVIEYYFLRSAKKKNSKSEKPLYTNQGYGEKTGTTRHTSVPRQHSTNTIVVMDIVTEEKKKQPVNKNNKKH